MHSTQSNKAITLWLLTGAILILGMVIIGGITRITGSGLSIVEWNVISGTLPPLSEAAWEAAFQKYQQFPEFQKVNFNMTLADFKQIFWWEYVHRLLGRGIGIVFLGPFLYFLFKRQLAGLLLKRLVVILLLGVAQGAMGWYMVKSGLVDNPHVSHYRLAAHLCLAVLLIGTILWTIADLQFQKQRQNHEDLRLIRLSTLVVAGVFFQIILGAFVAGLKAGFYYNTFPLMNTEFFPVVLTEILTWTNYLENGSLMQFVHRWFAFTVVLVVFLFWNRARHASLTRSTRNIMHLLFLTCLLQVTLGIMTLVLQVPVVLGVLHQALAVLLFSLATLAAHGLRRTYVEQKNNAESFFPQNRKQTRFLENAPKTVAEKVKVK